MTIKNGLVGEISESRSNDKHGREYKFRLESNLKPREERIIVPLPAHNIRAIVRFLKSRGHSASDGTGSVALHYDDKRITLGRFMPLGTYNKKGPFRKGIGTRVHHAIVEHLAETLKGRTIKHQSREKLSRRRILQLEAMGVDITREYPIEEYRDIVRRYMERKFGMTFET
ncbi:MAG: hypothetical protein V1644_00455 [Candidatus Micrarchaeota archaeon]